MELITVLNLLPVCWAASTSMTVLVLPSGPKVQTSFCTATLLVGGLRPRGDWHIPNCCWKKNKNKTFTRSLNKMKMACDVVVQQRSAFRMSITLYLWENIRSDHASPPLTGHPIRRPQGQRPFADICRDGVDHSSLHGSCISTMEGLVEAHHRWAGSRHNLVVSIVVWDGRLGGGQDGVGQVWSTGAGVRLLPAQLPSVIHRMLPKMHRRSYVRKRHEQLKTA